MNEQEKYVLQILFSTIITAVKEQDAETLHRLSYFLEFVSGIIELGIKEIELNPDELYSLMNSERTLDDLINMPVLGNA